MNYFINWLISFFTDKPKHPQIISQYQEAFDNFLPWIEMVEYAIFQDTLCPTQFERDFSDGNQILDVSFTSSGAKIEYVESNGNHVIKFIPHESIVEWLNDGKEIVDY